MVPLAPLRFSTTMVCPSASPILPATRRATRSSAGPGGNGTTMVMGFAASQPCAAAVSARAQQAASRQRRRRRTRRKETSRSLILFGHEPARLALLAEARAAFVCFRRVEALLEFALELGEQLRRRRRMRQTQQQPLGLRNR